MNMMKRLNGSGDQERAAGPAKGIMPWLLLLAVGLTGLAGRAQTPNVLGGKAKGIKFPEYYPPKAGQPPELKSLLTGDSARPLPNGQVLVDNLRIIDFKEKGLTNFAAESPQCRFDALSRLVWSEKLLTIRSPDDRFFIEGTGFLWNQASSSLTLSNQVRTLIRKPATPSSSPTPPAPERFDIQAQFANLDFKSGETLYRGHVLVDDGQHLRLACERMLAKIRLESNRLDSVLAEDAVTVDFRDKSSAVHLAGDQAFYATTPDGGESMEMTGHPTWQSGPMQGRADRLLLDPKKNQFQALTNGYLKILPPAPPADATAANPTEAAPRPMNSNRQPIEVAFDSGIFFTNEVVFQGHVAATQTDAMKMTCQRMVVKLTLENNRVDQIIAEENARLEIRTPTDSIQAAGDRMNYRLPAEGDELLDITGHPTWRSPRYRGQGDVLHINLSRQQFKSTGNTRIELSAPTPSPAAPPAADRASTNRLSLENQPITISSDDGEIQSDRASFRGHVQMSHPDWKLTCEEMQFTLNPTNHQIQTMRADRRVIIDHAGRPVKPRSPDSAAPAASRLFASNGLGLLPWTLACDRLEARTDPAGKQLETMEGWDGVIFERAGIRATGGHVTYQSTDGLTRLTDHPVVVAPNKGQMTGTADTVVTLDLPNNTVGTTGPVTLLVPRKAIAALDSPRPKP